MLTVACAVRTQLDSISRFYSAKKAEKNRPTLLNEGNPNQVSRHERRTASSHKPSRQTTNERQTNLNSQERRLRVPNTSSGPIWPRFFFPCHKSCRFFGKIRLPEVNSRPFVILPRRLSRKRSFRGHISVSRIRAICTSAGMPLSYNRNTCFSRWGNHDCL